MQAAEAGRAPFWRFSLRRLLALMAAVSALLASVVYSQSFSHTSDLAAIPIVAATVLLAGVLTRRWEVSVVVVVTAAVLSYALGPRMHWSGGYLEAQFEITVRDDRGVPIEGATLQVFDEDHTPTTRRLLGSNDTDTNGRMTLVSPGSGYGGESWFLFMLVPIGANSPQPYLVLSHPDFEQQSYNYHRFEDIEDFDWEAGPFVLVDRKTHPVDRMRHYHIGDRMPVIRRDFVMARR